MKIKYNGSVYTKAGFRGVTFTAHAEMISAKRCRITEVIEIDGKDVRAKMSRGGAKRQEFYGIGAASREIGKIKNISACEVVQQ